MCDRQILAWLLGTVISHLVYSDVAILHLQPNLLLPDSHLATIFSHLVFSFLRNTKSYLVTVFLHLIKISLSSYVYFLCLCLPKVRFSATQPPCRWCATWQNVSKQLWLSPATCDSMSCPTYFFCFSPLHFAVSYVKSCNEWWEKHWRWWRKSTTSEWEEKESKCMYNVGKKFTKYTMQGKATVAQWLSGWQLGSYYW